MFSYLVHRILLISVFSGKNISIHLIPRLRILYFLFLSFRGNIHLFNLIKIKTILMQLHKFILIASDSSYERLSKKSRVNVDKQLRIIKRENMVFKYSLSIMKSITFHWRGLFF